MCVCVCFIDFIVFRRFILSSFLLLLSSVFISALPVVPFLPSYFSIVK